MANTKIPSELIADSAITAAKLADGTITTADIADSNVTTAKIADSNVTTAKIGDAQVTTAKIVDANVTTAKIADDAVTTAKMASNSVTSDTIASGITLAGTTTLSSHLVMGDNDIIKVGDEADLQIYHDTNNSYIKDQGTGQLIIDGNAVILQYSSGSKLATTSTGIDVTGTVTSDGLTVESDTLSMSHTGNTSTISLTQKAGTQNSVATISANREDTSSSASRLLLSTNNGTSTLQRIRIANGGDISFYEDTGTTAKLLWDASAESLGIGTNDPQHKLDVEAGNNVFDLARFGSSASDNSEVTIGYFDSNANNGIPALIAASDFGGLIQGGEHGHLVLGIRDNDATDAVDIISGGGNFMTDSTYDTLVATFKANGNVGIGTDSPGERLVIKGTTSFMATNSTNRWMAYTYTDNTFRLNYNGAGADEFILDSSGNAGIGTAGSSSGIQLQIGNTSNNSAVTRVTNGTVHVDLTASSSGKAFLEVGTSHPLVLATNAEERMVIEAGGDVSVKAGKELRLYRTDNATYGSLEYMSGAGGLKLRDVNGDGMTFAGHSGNDYINILGSNGNVGINHGLGGGGINSKFNVFADGEAFRLDGTGGTSRTFRFRGCGTNGTSNAIITSDGILQLKTEDANAAIYLNSVRDIEFQTTSGNGTAGHMRFYSYNTQIMHIDGANNRVGIGTDNPSTKLTIKNDSNNTSFGDNNIITIQNASTTDNSRMGLAFTGNTGIGSGLAVMDAVSYDQSHGKTSLNFSVYSGSWHNDMMVLKEGNVAIGSTSDALENMSGLFRILDSTGGDRTVAHFGAHNYGDTGKTFINIGTEYGDGTSRIGSFNDTGNKSVLVFDTHSATSGQFTEQMRIKSDGQITTQGDILPGADIIMANGRGISFAATSNTSATGASMSNELLDDYEEGTWTPALVGLTTNSISTYGIFTKIGNLVHIHAKITATVASLPGATWTISGLPFSASNSSDAGQRAIITIGGDTLNLGSLANGRAHFRTNGSQLQGVYLNGGSTSYWTYNTMDSSSFELHISGTYRH